MEECHRNFFSNYAKGVPPRKCGTVEKHIGGLVGMVPVLTYHSAKPEKARSAALEHLSLTRPGEKMAGAGGLVSDLLLAVLNGRPLKDVILARINAQDHSLLGHPFKKWLDEPVDWVIGPKLSTACYVEHSVPAVLYLALKYHNDPEKALVINTNLGGRQRLPRGGAGSPAGRGARQKWGPATVGEWPARPAACSFPVFRLTKLIPSCNQNDLNICFCLYPPILATSKGGQAENGQTSDHQR